MVKQQKILQRHYYLQIGSSIFQCLLLFLLVLLVVVTSSTKYVNANVVDSITTTTTTTTTNNNKNSKCKDNQYYIFKRKSSSLPNNNGIIINNNNYNNTSQSQSQNQIVRTCEWVRKNPIRRCNFIDQNDIQVRDMCRETCKHCISTKEVRKNSFSIDTISSSISSISSSISREEKQNNKNIGQYCIFDSECESNICNENTCWKSEECKSIKHIHGQEFDNNVINIVFVGSGFEDLTSWRDAVAKTFRVFDYHEFLSFDNPRYNAFYVEEYDANSFCNYDCRDIKTLLCCNVNKAKALANKCFPSGSSHLQTIVIENNERYGGAGYYNQNVATTSIHDLGPTVAVHELGHSLFELGDEYTSGHFTAKNSANCDVKGCPKWADLDTYFGGGLCQVKGCENGNYFIGEESFMQKLEAPMGHVNLRYTCCTYLALTKGTPAYCQKYDFGKGLLEYCQKDHQHYGGSQMYVKEGGRTDDSATYTDKGKYSIAFSPVRLTLDIIENTFEYESSSSTLAQGPTMVQRREYVGDFVDLQAVCDSYVTNIIQITIQFDSGDVKVMYFTGDGDVVDVPPETESQSVKNATNNVFVQSNTLDIIVEATQGSVIWFDVQHIEITIWIRIRTWIVSHFQRFFSWMFSSGNKDSITSSESM